jgi:NAD(P)-dependent dehydrogenase (short-subunit alcohol dehydrogenase family)
VVTLWQPKWGEIEFVCYGPGEIRGVIVARKMMMPRGIDIIVNNVGVVSNALIEHTKPQEFKWMYRANVLGPLLLIQVTSPLLLHERTTRILNLSSIASTEGVVDNQSTVEPK